MSSRKGGYRRGGKQSHSHHHHRNDEHWILKPIQDNDLPPQSDQQFTLSTSEQILEQPTTTAPFSEFVAKNQKYHQNRRNSTWGPGSRRPQVVKAQFVKKSEVGSLGTVEKMDEKGEDSGDGFVVELEKDGSDNQIVEGDNEVEKKIEGSGLNEEDVVVDVPFS